MIGAKNPFSEIVPYLRRPLAVAALLLVPGTVLADEVIASDGVASEGAVMLIGDKKQWDTFVGDEARTSASGYLSVEPDADARAMRATWNGDGEAQFFLAYEKPQDYSAHLETNSALILLLKAKQSPKKKVTLRMGCGYPCSSNADVTKLLKALPLDEWVRLSFDLKCFADGGLNIKNVDTPMLLTTKGAMSLSIADVGIVSGLGPQATIRCRS